MHCSYQFRRRTAMSHSLATLSSPLCSGEGQQPSPTRTTSWAKATCPCLSLLIRPPLRSPFISVPSITKALGSALGALGAGRLVKVAHRTLSSTSGRRVQQAPRASRCGRPGPPVRASGLLSLESVRIAALPSCTCQSCVAGRAATWSQPASLPVRYFRRPPGRRDASLLPAWAWRTLRASLPVGQWCATRARAHLASESARRRRPRAPLLRPCRSAVPVTATVEGPRGAGPGAPGRARDKAGLRVAEPTPAPPPGEAPDERACPYRIWRPRSPGPATACSAAASLACPAPSARLRGPRRSGLVGVRSRPRAVLSQPPPWRAAPRSLGGSATLWTRPAAGRARTCDSACVGGGGRSLILGKHAEPAGVALGKHEWADLRSCRELATRFLPVWSGGELLMAFCRCPGSGLDRMASQPR
eukprot:scaffold569_cov408-Prasinococcus_capsulatus_cf.AAC.31